MNDRLELELLEEYTKLSEVEKAIKERKEEIKQYYTNYMEENNLFSTPNYKKFIGKLEERTSYTLDVEVMEQELPPAVFNSIVKKEIDTTKAKGQFLNGRIPIDLLQRAERIEKKYIFYIRKTDAKEKENKTIPFWRTER